jgi:hypothetical protein
MKVSVPAKKINKKRALEGLDLTQIPSKVNGGQLEVFV